MDTERANVVSSYTIVKGSMIAETFSVLTAWDFTKSKKGNLDLLRSSNFIEAKSDSWLRDVAKVLNRRFDPAGRDRALAVTAKSGYDIEEWKPILLWHMTRDEFLLKDFLIHWLFPTCYDSSACHVRSDDLQIYLLNIHKRGGTTEHAWTKTTLHRVATALLRVAADFGILKGNGVKAFAPYNLPERSFIYLFQVMLDKYKCPKKVINAIEWRMFLLCPSDVERQIFRLHQNGTLEYEIVDNLAQLTLPNNNTEKYMRTMNEFAPGDRCEVDYSNDKIEWLDPNTQQVRQAHIFLGVLGFSQFIFAWASEDKKGPSWLQAHSKMFDVFGGVPSLIVCSCPKQSLIKPHRHDPEINPGYDEIAAHYMTTVIPARPGFQKDRALIEDAEKIVMRSFQFIYRRHTFTSIAEINYALAHVIDRLNRKPRPQKKTSRLECWASQERHALKTMPTVAFEAVEWNLARVHPDSTVSLESAYYSVPHVHRGKEVRVKRTPTNVEIFVGLDRVAIHKRDFARRSTRYIIPGHFPDNVTAYREIVPQKLLSQARLVTESLYDVIEELFTKDTLGNLRRAQRLIRRANAEIKDCGRENAEPRLQVAIEQMYRVSNFRVHYFEATLQQLRQKSNDQSQSAKMNPPTAYFERFGIHLLDSKKTSIASEITCKS